MIKLVPVSTPDQVEWLRVQRSRPELYKYFRQDHALSPEMQRRWWHDLDKTTVRLFIVQNENEQVGYVGFNPFSQRSLRAEFGIFVIPEEQRKGYATLALRELLKKGFEDYRLSTIYSDVLDYQGENRFDFYKSLGFEAFPQEHQGKGYMKQGKYVPSIKFFMTKDIWNQIKETHGKDGNGPVGPIQAPEVVRRKRGRPRKVR